MDPEEPLYTELVSPYIENQRKFKDEQPEKQSVLEIQQSQLYDFLINEHWKTPREVQSQITHTLMDLKHRFQEELLGEKEKKGWNRFNEYYLDQITKISEEYQDKRILVTIGIEHVYWLQKELRKISNLEVIDASTVIQSS